MKSKTKQFIQDLYHEIDGEDEAEKYLDESLPMIGHVVMFFNALEQNLDHVICEIFSFRTSSVGLIVLHKMNYAAKVELFKRFCDDLHTTCDIEILGYQDLIQNLKECGRLRNLVVHADWLSTDHEGYTFVNLKISKSGMNQEYVQFSTESLEKILDLITKTNHQLSDYWEERNEKLFKK